MSVGVRDVVIDRLTADPVVGLDPMAFDNFQQVVSVRPDDNVLLLMDRTIDPRVPAFLWDFARGRGAEVRSVVVERAGSSDFPDSARPIIEEATLVLTTWFSSSIDPYFLGLRSGSGQRYVKLTYFRNLDLMRSEAARFPIELISMLIRRTAESFPRDRDSHVHLTDPRGSDLHIHLTPEIVSRLMTQSRWRGEMSADRAGAYVHWIPTHGPNFWDLTSVDRFFSGVEGQVVPHMAVGFPDDFPAPPEIILEGNRVTDVRKGGDQGVLLRQMMMESTVIEVGCGFNPKHPRRQIYPAGSNSAGAIHVGLDLISGADYLDRVMPDWPEPPEHVDLVILDATVTINGEYVVEDGVLSVLRDAEIRKAASRYGSPAHLLEGWPEV